MESRLKITTGRRALNQLKKKYRPHSLGFSICPDLKGSSAKIMIEFKNVFTL